MKIGFYPGSFDRWHPGHGDVLDKSLKLFDKIVILQLRNPGKPAPAPMQFTEMDPKYLDHDYDFRIDIIRDFNNSLNSAIGNYLLEENEEDFSHRYAIVRGLRDECDFREEQKLNYWYEDIGIKIPVFYIISDRKMVHYSSSAFKALNIIQEKK